MVKGKKQLLRRYTTRLLAETPLSSKTAASAQEPLQQLTTLTGLHCSGILRPISLVCCFSKELHHKAAMAWKLS